MYYKVLACNVLTREIGWCAARCLNTLDIVFFAKDEHNAPSRLREMLQAEIDRAASEAVRYDAVLLAYGLCGNATVGLVARDCPLIVPRAHDCTTLFLGSRDKFKEHFGDNPSQPWTSLGYSERGDTLISEGNARVFGEGHTSFAELVETYGEENARYIMEAMSAGQESDTLPLLDVPETRIQALLERLKQRISDSGKNAKLIEGGVSLVEELFAGDWSTERFLVVPPGRRIEGVYDYDQILTISEE